MKKIIIFLIVIIIVAVGGYYGFRRVYSLAGKKVLEQMVQEIPTPEVAEISEETADEESPVAKAETAKSAETDKPTKYTEPAGPPPQKSVEKKAEELPANIMDHPYVKSIYARFSSAEVSEVASMSAGGFTPEERARAKAIITSKVSGAEISELQRIYNLYY